MKIHKKIYITTFFLTMLCSSVYSVEGPGDIPRMDFDQLEPLLQKDNDTVYVVNFWATWCKPCVKELPYFEQINREYSGKNVRVILVSLDFPNKHEELLLPFIDDKQLKSEVIHLVDVDANSWIDKVNSSWSGAIPATLIYKGSDRNFHEGSMDYEEIKSLVEPKIIEQ